MNNFAHLKEDSPFARLFDNRMVPIKNILIPKQGNMINGGGVQDYYEVDVAKLTPEQIKGIAQMVATQCGGSPAEVEEEMRRRGMIPLRAIHVSSISSNAMTFL